MKILKLSETSKIPTNKPGDVGYDLYADEIVIEEYKVIVKTNIAVELPEHTWGLIADRSSMGSKGFKVHGGIIDNSYRGNIMVILYYHGQLPIPIINKGDKIAQLIIMPEIKPEFETVDALSQTDRNDKGFGSTGK